MPVFIRHLHSTMVPKLVSLHAILAKEIREAERPPEMMHYISFRECFPQESLSLLPSTYLTWYIVTHLLRGSL
jgi:hypothetical protein